MSITQETANLVDTLANAASKIGSTAASAKINQLIVDLLPATSNDESVAEALRQDNITLQLELDSVQNSSRTMADNLELLRGKMEQIYQITFDLLQTAPHDEDGAKLEQILDLSKPIDAPVEA